ncbi:hypothetical protein BCR34DRAFT_477776 [Clohesyomyces aquaticus]|uniref:RING-type domain-containing protein n=1 Tax=Clohesyomyces aquaticus TaxID=1231657 RepID=A0A1Y1ZZE3_9PLEO|nr:hypothetical protein BCR34DRAFT_477776 [Clohesyomyces aquaticus]
MAQKVPGHLDFVNLLSDDEQSDAAEDTPTDYDDSDYDYALFNDVFDINGRDNDHPIDLTALEDIPDVDVPPDGAPLQRLSVEDAETLGEAECLQMVLNVLPDIAIDHVLHLISEQAGEGLIAVTKCEQLVARILDDGSYPKESDEISKRKRKRNDDDDDTSEFEKGGQEEVSNAYTVNASNLLKDEFPEIPARHIENTLKKEKTLCKAFGTLNRQLNTYNRTSSEFCKVINPRKNREHERTIGHSRNSEAQGFNARELLRELQAARKKRDKDLAKHLQDMEDKEAEKQNLLRARENNAINDCQICFDEFPINRMISCNGGEIHLLCTSCAKSSVEMLMSNGKCRPECQAAEKCQGTYTRGQLRDFLGRGSFERLERLQQQEDISAAGIENLGECPFCDFKAECEPVYIDREFRCQNPDCGKTSCRLCNQETHVPKSCEEAKKDGKITIRHQVEEAMSNALIRKCNRCANPFVKEYGCNKMTCTKCANVQCYVCSKDVRNYDHFADNVPNRCPLHDNVESRHEQEVKKAEADVLARLRTEHPDISEEELKVEVSDAVRREENARREQARIRDQGFPYVMQGGALAQRAHPPPPPPPLPPAQPQPNFPFNLFPGYQIQNAAVLPYMPPMQALAGHPQPLNPGQPQPVGHGNPFNQVRHEYVYFPNPNANGWFLGQQPPNQN